MSNRTHAAVLRLLSLPRTEHRSEADACGGCHGPNREGATGPALILGRLTADDDFYFDVIKDGRPGTIMPAWGQLGLGDEEIWGLVGFIRSQPEAGTVEWGLDEIKGSLKGHRHRGHEPGR